LRARADGIDAAKRQEALAAKRRLRIGFQIVMLAAIGLVAFTLIFPTLRLHMAQQVQIRDLRAQVAVAAQTSAELEAALKRWEDPAYVKAQARERLSFAMPGDRTFRVADPENAPTPSAAPQPVSEPTHLSDDATASNTDPWYVELWESALVAGKVGTP
jgi:cell division protein FtsB